MSHQPTLYYYEHCPYCVRVLTFAGLAGITLNHVVLLNDDEATPIRLVGKKMVPILSMTADKHMGESLDIIDYLSQQSGFDLADVSALQNDVEQLLAEARVANYSLSMPRWIRLPLKEFATPAAIDYFVAKKTQTLGDFDAALAQTDTFISALKQTLVKYDQLFQSLSQQPISRQAVIVFAALHGISSVKGFSWTPASDAFMTLMSEKSGIRLYTEQAI